MRSRLCSVLACVAISTHSVVGEESSGHGQHQSDPVQEACDKEWRVSLLEGSPPQNEVVAPTPEVYAEALRLFLAFNLTDLKHDLKSLYKESHPCWPSDFSTPGVDGHYGPFFTRLAWHCSGSYRQDDMTGGCGGGRQRFDPERSWDDNSNLDKARALLAPLKKKYGDGLSWGDLFVAAGTTALIDMGAPLSRTCFGRIDDTDGAKSTLLGPSVAQEEQFPCAHDGNCSRSEGLGTFKIGLIYLNPEGKDMADGTVNPDPALSVIDIRDAFGRMGHSDEGTVALIGGGHAIGKTHGACPKGPGECNTDFRSLIGRGHNTFTSGFEGPWTMRPTTWSNDFFTGLKEHTWELFTGPGGHYQWKAVDPSYAGLMRLTSDMALLHDPIYLSYVNTFAEDMTVFNQAFDVAWDLLTVVDGFGTWSPGAWCDNFAHSDPRFDLKGHPGRVPMLETDIVV